jgi:antitoxin MazE
MKNRVQKWGNSLAVRIPKAFAEGLGWRENAPVEMAVDGDRLVVNTDRERTWNLDALLVGVTDDNVHPAWEADVVSAADPEEAAKDSR